MIRYEMTAYDGKKISVVEWKKADKPRGIVLICHGMVEHALRYEYIAEKLANEGYVVVCDDHRAHGYTDKEHLGFCEGDIFNDTLKDMAQLCENYKQKYPELKIILFGHSYGSFLSQRFIEEYNSYLSGVILGGSACMNDFSPVAGGVIANIGYKFKGKDKPAKLIKSITFDGYLKKLKMNTFISSIPEEAERYNKDEFCGYICSQAFYKYFFKGLKSIYKKENINKLNVDLPVLIISGENDPVGSFTKSTDKLYKLYKDNGIKDVTLKYYRGGVLHEYLNDISREESSNDILNFANTYLKV